MKETLLLPPVAEGLIWQVRNLARSIPPHRHDELEVNLVLQGTGSYLMGDRRVQLRRGTMIWLFPGQDHVLIDQSPDFGMWIGVFRPAMVERACTTPSTAVLKEQNPPGRFSRQIAREPLARLHALLSDIEKISGTGPAMRRVIAPAEIDRYNAAVAYALLTAWAVHQSAGDDAVGTDIHPAVEICARLLRDESEPMNLDELASRSGLSPSRLSELFKKQIGLPLVQYRQRQCLDRFLRLYDGQRQTMLDAALQAGFGSYPQFHRAFKQLMGIGPAEFRRREK